MEYSHLKDIWVLNFTLPIVLSPRQGEVWCFEQLRAHPSDTCQKEYTRHFAGTKYLPNDPLNTEILHHGFSGVVTYWVVYGVCEAATYGTGFFLICSPAATISEVSIEMYVAPDVSKTIWNRYN